MKNIKSPSQKWAWIWKELRNGLQNKENIKEQFRQTG